MLRLSLSMVACSGIGQDIDQAAFWYEKSVAQGYPDAIEAMKRLRKM